MTDEPDRPLTPEQEREVRRLLADARHTEPMPVDVSARLDRVLADLATQDTDHAEPDTSVPATVVSLTSRRRRRAASLLVAAAAVVAVGVGIDQLTHLAGTGGSASSDSAATSDVGSGSGRSSLKPENRGSTPGNDQLGSDSPNAAQAGPRLLPLARAVPLRSGHFARDVARARRLTHERNVYGDLDTRHHGFTCTPGDWGRGTFVPVRYDGRRGVLAFRAVNGDTQVVDLYGCGSSQVLRSITLPAR